MTDAGPIPAGSTADVPRRRRLASPLALFVLAAGLRVLYVLALRDHPRFDAPAMDAGYHLAWANALAAGHEFQDGPFFRAPLYPMFLAVWTLLSPEHTLLARLMQALLGGLTAVLTFRLANRVAGERVGLVAGALVALSWVMVAFDAELLIPTLLVPLLLIALDRAVAWNGEDRPRAALLTGVAFGLAAIARPNALLFMPVLFAWTIVRTRRMRAALALTAGTLLPILPVTLHNALEGDTALIATQAGVNLWIGNNPGSDGATAIVPGTREGWWEGYRDSIAQAEAAEGRELRPTEVSRHYAARARDWARSEPGSAARLTAWKARLLVTNVELANNQDIRFTAFRTLPALRLTPSRWDVLFGFGVTGLVLALVRRKRGAGVLAAFLVVYAISIVVFFVNARFRVPLLPVLAVGSAYALVEAHGALRARRWPLLASVIVPSLGMLIVSNLVPSAIDESDAAGFADLGRAELSRGNAAVALDHLETAAGLSPESVQVRTALASAIAAAENDPSRALRVLEEARSLPRGKDSPELEARILDMRVTAGDAVGALAAARAALVTRPDDGALLYVMARAQATLGRTSAALVTLERLSVSEPTNATAALAIAQILSQAGARDEAIAAFQRALALGDFATPSELAQIQQGLAALGGD